MMMNLRKSLLCAAALGSALCMSGPAQASLVIFQTYTGNVGYSADGFGSLSQAGTISASAPVGSTVLGAYLYSATYDHPSGSGVGGTLEGVALTGGSFVFNPSVCCDLGSTRFDVTSIVKPIIDAGPGGIYDFDITENDFRQDGEALIVVYENASLGTNTVAILDGYSSAGGDSFTATFGTPLDPTAPGFFAEMALGIGFSCCGQMSTVEVNGTTITDSAGNNDDNADPSLSNGNLFTMGGFDDPHSPFLPSYEDDHERYSLVPYIDLGDTSITVETNNPSNDDNIFVAVFSLLGEAIVVGEPVIPEVPEPSTIALLSLGMICLAGRRLRRRK